MPKRFRLFPFAAIVLLTPALFADDLVKYKEWGSSPQGYFMTKAERTQWAAIKSDDEAEQFVNRFLASRKPDFAAEVAKRAQMADKYLTLGKTPGSKTLRGKIIILFGPPSGFDVMRRQGSGERSASVGGYMGAAGAGDGRGGSPGPSPADMVDAAQRADMSGKEIRQYTFTYTGDKLPTPRAESLTVAVDLDTGNGREWLAERNLMSELDELFDAAAATWLLARRSPATP